MTNHVLTTACTVQTHIHVHVQLLCCYVHASTHLEGDYNNSRCTSRAVLPLLSQHSLHAASIDTAHTGQEGEGEGGRGER